VSADTIQKARTFLSSVLRHAAESSAILANPIVLVRAPKGAQRDEVVPLAPVTVERIRSVLWSPMPVPVPEGKRKTARRRAYEMPDQRSATVRQRDACLVSLLAYSGLRPQEAAALRWSDVRERTILVQRATEPDGAVKATKGKRAAAFGCFHRSPGICGSGPRGRPTFGQGVRLPPRRR
jgi:integrase